MSRAARQRGFTLLEVLVAVALFAIAAVLAYGGLRGIVAAQAQGNEAKAQLGRLQFAIGLIERDIASASRRGVRDAFGVPRPALEGEPLRIELTRYGHANVLALPRAEMERVSYLRREERLLRLRFHHLEIQTWHFRHADVRPRMQCHQLHAPARGLVKGDLRRLF